MHELFKTQRKHQGSLRQKLQQENAGMVPVLATLFLIFVPVAVFLAFLCNHEVCSIVCLKDFRDVLTSSEAFGGCFHSQNMHVFIALRIGSRQIFILCWLVFLEIWFRQMITALHDIFLVSFPSPLSQVVAFNLSC